VRNREGGSVVAILISTLTLALCVALGVLFYQNFVAKPLSQPKAADSSAPQTPVPLVKDIAFGGVIYELQYPAREWTVATNLDEHSRLGSSKTYFDNSEGTVRVEFSLYEAWSEDLCDPNSERKIGYITVDPTMNSILSDEPLYLVETIFDGPEKGYNYKIGLTPDGAAIHAIPGQTICTVSLVGVTPKVMNGEVVKRPVIVANIQFPEIDKRFTSKIPDMKTIRDLLETESFKQAKAILQSARKK
jgi:hypothetical protein